MFLKKSTILLLMLTCFVMAGPWDEHGALQVSEHNPHYLSFSDGEPFFWLGDTAWMLFYRLNRQEAVHYLQNRAENEFNVIQAVVLSENHGLTIPNAHGDLPLQDKDPLHPIVIPGNNSADDAEYDYFDHVEFIVQEAEKLGLYIGMLPCWGEYVIPRQGRGIFNTIEQSYGFGNFLGKRFAEYPNIIWILGGDRHPDERLEGVALWRAMAEGIADGVNGVHQLNGEADYNTTLMTHHSYNSSSNWFYQDEWIDLHTWGSYHADYNLDRAYKLAEKDYNLSSPKPTLNSEPAYEQIVVNYMDNNGRFTAFDVRQIAYWSVFAGCCGHTYGANPIWQCYDKGRQSLYFAEKTWKEALEFAGGQQMKYLKRLVESRPMLDLVPDQSLIVNGQSSGSGVIRAIRGKSHAFVYIPTGAVITVQMGNISGDRIVAHWFNPRSGVYSKIGELANSGTQTFNPPGLSQELPWLQTGRGCDWVLILDDSQVGY